jgi:L-phenylalanine/L-methionine N-acetyltransferase
LIRARKYTSNLFVVRNDMGIALYEKFGFEREGTHRRYAFRGGEYVDAYSMARIKPPES